VLTVGAALLLAGCGGGGGSGGGVAPAAGCSVGELNSWLSDYMDEWYFWRAVSPRPVPNDQTPLASYFAALLYRGGLAPFPADRWSFTETTASFNRLFGDGQSLGYGVSVAGLEVSGRPDQPLYVRYVEALSPAALAGVKRGDRVLSLNGVPSSDVISRNDFSALTASAEGQTLVLGLQQAGAASTVTLSSRAYNLTPVSQDAIVTTPGGVKLGYLVVKDMISQVNAPLDAAFGRFRTAGVQGVVLDLRYNGGGLVSVASTIGSYLAGPRANGRVFTSLLYNDRRAATNNTVYRFNTPAQAVDAPRVWVLAGARTCSASELVINGLRGAGLDVVVVGDTSCGKPVGFLPTSQCGTTFNAVNFESVNDRGEGRYVDGIAPTCRLAEDFTTPLGSTAEPLLAAALRHADTGVCPAVAAGQAQVLASPRHADGGRSDARDGGERPGMLDR
jgi:C-terminal processing protease CtpA/Prc